MVEYWDRNPWLASKFNQVSIMNLFADIVLIGIWFLVSFFLILNLLPCDLNTKDLIKFLKNVDTFLDNGRKMKVWKLLTVLICGYKFINRGFEVVYVKTYWLISRGAVSPCESWHCSIEHWKSLNRMANVLLDPCWPR